MGNNNPRVKRYRVFITVISLGIIVMASIILAIGPTDEWWPLIGGIQIYDMNNGNTCSIGYPAYIYDEYTDRYYYGVVTASHCGDLGDDVYQPDSNGRYIGYFYIDPSLPRNSDSAFILTESSWSSNPTTITDKVYSDYSIDKYDYIDGYKSSYTLISGIDLYKSGRTTGTTAGKLICVYYGVYKWTSNIWIRNPIIADFYSSYGDSGGTIFVVDTNNWPDSSLVSIVGIVNGWDDYNPCSGKYEYIKIGSPIDSIKNDLGVEGYD